MNIKHLRITNCSRIADIDIEVRDNMVLIGPNGSGKTTVLLCLDMVLGMDERHLCETISQDFIRDKSQPMTVEVVLGNQDDNEATTIVEATNAPHENNLVIRLDAHSNESGVSIARNFSNCETQSELSQIQKKTYSWALVHEQAIKFALGSTEGFDSASEVRALLETDEQSLLNEKTSILAIDEPEAHLHPSSQRSLAKVLKANGGQKILVTHSPTIAGAFEPDEIVVIHANGTAVQPKRGFLSGDAGVLARWWIGRQLEPLTAGAVIAVEGPSDRIIVDKVASALDFDLDHHDVVLIETNGCGDMKVVESIFGSGGFDIPLFELVDDDASETAAKRLHIDPADLEAHDVFVSIRDLEDEYVQAIGAKKLWDRMKAANTFSRSVFSLCNVGPDGYPTEADLAEFIRGKSSRKIPSALAAAELIDETNAPCMGSVARLLKAASS